MVDGLEYRHTGGVTSLIEVEAVDRMRRLAWSWHRLVHVCSTGRWRRAIHRLCIAKLDRRLVSAPQTRMDLTGI
jgi:hypothetical protein